MILGGQYIDSVGPGTYLGQKCNMGYTNLGCQVYQNILLAADSNDFLRYILIHVGQEHNVGYTNHSS